MRNDLVRDAITRLNAHPGDEARIGFYRQLGQGLLLVIVADLPAGLGLGEILLDHDTTVSMLTTSLPSGGDAVVAFTDLESLEARARGAKHIGLRSVDLLRLVIDGGYGGLIVNPAGSWAGVPRDDVRRILDGAWSTTDT